MAVLSEGLVLQKCKVESLAQVRNLNLWGTEIEDASIVARMPQLEVAALSVNCIRTLRDFAECKALRELYLRRNEIASLAEVQHLSRLPSLAVLWLSDNPCASHRLYRSFTLRCCPHVKTLDNVEVTAAERAAAERLTPAEIAEVMGSVTARVSSAPAAAAPLAPSRAQPQIVTPAPAPAPVPVPAPAPTASAPPSSRPVQTPPAPPVQQPQPVPTSRHTQKAMLSAILALLPELAPESLQFLQDECRNRLAVARR
jgi:hypothetical protein